MPNEYPYGVPGEANETQDMDAFPPLLRLCERGLVIPARLGEELIRCRPLSSRCLPFVLGFSMGIASLGGVGGVEGTGLCSSTTIESMESGSMVKRAVRRGRSNLGRPNAGATNGLVKVWGGQILGKEQTLCKQREERVRASCSRRGGWVERFLIAGMVLVRESGEMARVHGEGNRRTGLWTMFSRQHGARHEQPVRWKRQCGYWQLCALVEDWQATRCIHSISSHMQLSCGPVLSQLPAINRAPRAPPAGRIITCTALTLQAASMVA